MPLGRMVTSPRAMARRPNSHAPAWAEQAHRWVANTPAQGRSRVLRRFLAGSPGAEVLWLWQMRTGTPAAQAAPRANTDRLFIPAWTIW